MTSKKYLYYPSGKKAGTKLNAYDYKKKEIMFILVNKTKYNRITGVKHPYLMSNNALYSEYFSPTRHDSCLMVFA
jgi:hypothetical protein